MRQIPQLDARLTYRGDSTFARYRWIADAKDFHMPVMPGVPFGPHLLLNATAAISWSAQILLLVSCKNILRWTGHPRSV